MHRERIQQQKKKQELRSCFPSAMRALQRSVEWLRPLVDSMAWDYAVVWKLVGDGPSGFVEWVGCCCCGGGSIFDGVKEEKQEDDAQLHHSTTPICSDHRNQHPMRTRACVALALYPSSFPLCSGIHGEVVISNQPRWIGKARSASDANFVQEFTGTSVLVPVVGGIVELFSTKLMPEEPHKIEIIRTWSRFLREAVNAGICDLSIDEFLIREYFKFYPSPLHLSSLDSGLQQLPTGTQSSNNPEGSSSSSDLTYEYPSFDPYNILGYLSQAGLMKQSVLESTGSKDSKSLSKETNFSGCNAAAATQKGVHKQEGGKCEAKNLVTERKRRTRIKERLYTLRSLVPKISKMDMTSILGDAAEYIEDLQMEVRKLEEELEELEEEVVCRPKDTNSKSLARSVGHDCSKSLARQQVNQESSRLDLKTETKAQVEVNQIGEGDFLVKIVMLQKQGWFSRMMEGIHSLGYTVVNANITTLNGKVLANLILELRDGALPKNLRESLMQLASLIGQ